MTTFGESEVVSTIESCAGTGVCAEGAEDVVGEGLLTAGSGRASRGELLRTEGVGIYPSVGGDDVGTDAESEVEVLCKV